QSINLRTHRRSPIFPYTTLFRSVAELRGATYLVGHSGDEGLGERHHVVVVGVGLVELEHRELRIPARADALVAEHASDLEHLLRSEEHTSELQSLRHLVCRLLLE